MDNQTTKAGGIMDAAANATQWSSLLFLFPSLLIFWCVLGQITSPVRGYPGPWLARYTNWWRTWYTSRRNIHLVYQKLHEKYGPIVRVGPNVLDVDLPEIVKPAFSDIKSDWQKTDFYHSSSAKVNGKLIFNLFSETDGKKHGREKKPIAKYYSQVAVRALEPHVDAMISKLCQSLDSRFADSGRGFDLGRWLLFYAWDVVGSVTFSRPFGYLDKGLDFDGTLGDSAMVQDYFSLVGAVPSLDRWLGKNPIKPVGVPGFHAMMGRIMKHLADRYQGNDKTYHDSKEPDFLDHFIEAKKADPEEVDDAQIVSWLMINVMAGADTTALALKTAFYYCLRDERVWRRLRKELLAAGGKGPTPVPYEVAHSAPYLEAVVREALRILPGISMSLERYVPEEGHRLSDGSFLPGGSTIGVNPYLIARNKEIYGDDVEEFRPERWLLDEAAGETQEQFEARLAAMNSVDLTFGGGRRICIGKNLGLLQVCKVLATLVTSYEMELVDPKRKWRVINSWFPRQEGGLDISITRRKST